MSSKLAHLTVEEIALEMGDAPFGSNLKTKDYTDSGALVVQGKNVQGRWFDWRDKRHVSFEKYESIPRSHCFPGDMIFPKVGTIGKVGILSACEGYDKYILSTNTMRLKVDPIKANPLFIYYYFTWSRTVNLIHAMNSKSVQPVFNFTTLKKFPLELPNLDAQNHAAKTFDAIDRKININSETNQTLEQIAQALFKSWFVDFEPVKAKVSILETGGAAEEAELAAMGIIAAKNSEQLAELKQSNPQAYEKLVQTAALFPSTMQGSELGRIPEGWKITTVRDVAATIKGKSYKSAELEQSKTALVTLKSFNRGGGYRLDGLKEYTGKYKPDQEVFAGDLIIAYTDVTQAADVIGKPAMVISDARYEHLVISLDVAVVRPLDDNLKYYLYGMAKTDEFQQHTQAHSTGTTVLHLSKNAVPDYKFILANEDLVKAYVEHAEPIFYQINETIEENNSLAELRDALLPKLLSGEIQDA